MKNEAPRRARVVTGLRALLGLLMIVAGVMHFVTPDFYVAMMPDYLPWHLALVYLSGIAEVALGAALFVPKPRLRALAGWGLVALFVAVLPANVWMATEGPPPGMELSPVMAWVRVGFQPLFMYWAWAVTRPNPGPDSP